MTGLSYIHKLGIVHGELTPSNILITKEYRAKISNLNYKKFSFKDNKQ